MCVSSRIGFQISCAAQDSHLIILTQSLTNDPSLNPVVLRDLHLTQGALSLTLYTYDGASTTAYKKGLTLEASVRVQGQTTAALLQTLSKGGCLSLFVCFSLSVCVCVCVCDCFDFILLCVRE